MKILIAADGSTYTKRMLAYLAAHDEWLGPAHSYTVLTVTPSLPPRATAMLDKELIRTYHAEEAERVFKPIRTFFGRRGMQVDYLFKTGGAADIIARTADSGGFDLLVMGSHGHNALGTLVMGSVTVKVLAQCKVPVLLVR